MSRESGPWEYTVLVLGGLAYVCYTFIWFTLPALLSPIIDEFGLSTTEAGVLVGAVPLVYVPFSLVSGLLIDRVGSRVAIGVGLAGFGAIQLARGVAEGYLGMLVPTLLLGVVGMTITFGLPKLVSELFPDDRIGTMSSVYQVGSYLGAVVAYALSRPYLEPALGGWRPVFVASGVVVLVFAVVWVVVSTIYFRARDPDLRGDGRGGAGQNETAFSLASMRSDLDRLFSSRDMRLLVVAGTMFLFISHGLRGWLPTALEATGVSPEVAGILTSLLIVASIAGALTIPPLSDRWDRRTAAISASGLLCVAGSVALVFGLSSVPMVLLSVWVIGMGLGGVEPILKAMPIEMDGIGPALTATAVSFIFAIGQMGGFVGPFAIGALHDLTGLYEAGLALLVAASVVILVVGFAMGSPQRG